VQRQATAPDKKQEEPRKKPAEAVVQRYLPVGSNPEIALDSRPARHRLTSSFAASFVFVGTMLFISF
jgi:hypothetical protein